jgi:hypothetical protein
MTTVIYLDSVIHMETTSAVFTEEMIPSLTGTNTRTFLGWFDFLGTQVVVGTGVADDIYGSINPNDGKRYIFLYSKWEYASAGAPNAAVDATKLDSQMEHVADTIRDKTGDADIMPWPDGFIEKIGSIKGEMVGGVADVTINTASNTVKITIPTDIAGKDILCLGTGVVAMMAGGQKTMDYFLILIDRGAIVRSARIGYNGKVPFLTPSVTASLSGNDIILSGVASDYQTYINYTIWAEIQYGQ